MRPKDSADLAGLPVVNSSNSPSAVPGMGRTAPAEQ